MNKPRIIVLTAFAGLFAWVFGDALFGSGVFVFRDAGHYYYPLFEFVKSEWAAGRVPLWNPYENLGVPLAANATSSVFYPGSLVFLLPLDYAWAFNIYVLGHVLLAAAAAYRLARRFGASVTAAGVACISYAFSGNVLFQYCNVIFLVGAAWLPLAVLTADRMLRAGQGGTRLKQIRWAIGLGVILALITLGGNAEMAYHAGLLAATYALWLWWYDRRACSAGRSEAGLKSPGTAGPTLLTSRPLLLATAAGVGFVLSAVQVLPSIEFTRRSGRAVSAVPRSLWEVPQYLVDDEPKQGTGLQTSPGFGDGLTCRRLDSGTHHQHVYHFSVGPWRLAEYVWPNCAGRQFPVNRRWAEAIPAEGRLWVPSLYMGLVPLVLAILAMRFRRADARRTWLTWTVVLAVLASFGWYGLGWVVEEIRLAAGAEVSSQGLVGAPAGGLYWLATVVLPGYVYFRYPAKLLVIAALGLSMLSAAGWDRAFADRSTRLRRGLLWLAGLSMIGAIAALATRPLWNDWLSGVPADVLFGPLDTAGANTDVLLAFLQTALTCCVFAWLLRRSDAGAKWPQAAALLLVAVDLAAANGWMVVCAPAEQFREQPLLAAAIQSHSHSATANDRSRPPVYRVWRRGIWTPPAWQTHSSANRLVESARWDRHTLWPKYNLSPGISLSEVQSTMMPHDYQVLLGREKRGHSTFSIHDLPASADERAEKMQSASLFSTVRYFILRGAEQLDEGHRIDLGALGAGHLDDVSLWENGRWLPRAWIARDGGTASGEEICRVTHYDPLRVEIEAVLSEPGVVVLADQFYPGWKLDVHSAGQGARRVPIESVAGVMRGARLEAGSHRLVYRYRPASFLWGAGISGVAWLALAILATIAPYRVPAPSRRSADKSIR